VVEHLPFFIPAMSILISSRALTRADPDGRRELRTAIPPSLLDAGRR